MKQGVRQILIAVAVTIVAGAPGAADTAEDLFNSLYGEKVKQVTGTPDRGDDVALAGELVAAAREAGDRPELLALLCRKACELGRADRQGHGTAIEAMKLLAERVPGQALAAQQQITQVYQEAYRRGRGVEKKQAEQELVRSILREAELHDARGNCAEAVKLAGQAARYAPTLGAELKDHATDRLKYFRHRQIAARRIATMAKRLEANPSDHRLRNDLIEAHVVDFDSPAKALPLLTADCDQELRTYVPLAAGDEAALPETACLELADWYRSLAAQADAPAKPAMLLRAKGYYERFLAVHTAEDDATLKARLGLKQVVRDLAALGVSLDPAEGAGAGRIRKMSPEILAFVAERATMPLDKQIEVTLAKLREVNRSRGESIVFRASTEGGEVTAILFPVTTIQTPAGPNFSNYDLRNIDPLYGLPLKKLDFIANCAVRGDLAALAGMKLEHLDLRGCRQLRSLSGIQGMPLETLTLPASKHISGDLSMLAGMKTLRRLLIQELSITSLKDLQDTSLQVLTLANCGNLRSLRGLEGLPLETLSVLRCKGLREISCLAKLTKLTHLNLNKCENLMSLQGIQDLPLVSISLEGCQRLRRADYLLLTRIPTLADVKTGDEKTDEEILARCRRLRGSAK